jgi:type II secretory pathway pseudopilin PulG
MKSKSHRDQAGFTLVELLGVISVMTVLMGMTIGILRYASGKSARERARAEIAGFVGGAENYKTDMGTYPRNGETDQMSGGAGANSEKYQGASLAFYRMVSGDADVNGVPDKDEGVVNPPNVYMEFKNSQLGKSGSSVRYLRDPWDRPSAKSSYGYSTRRASLLESGSDDSAAGRNTTFDIWSTANTPDNSKAWIGNW